MTTYEILKQLCEKEGTSIAALEKEMGYGNGYLARAKSLTSDRVYELARRFKVPMEYIMTGEVERVNEETQKLERKRTVLMEINNVNQQIMDCYKALTALQNRLDDLNRKYEAILTEESIPTVAELMPGKEISSNYWGKIGNE